MTSTIGKVAIHCPSCGQSDQVEKVSTLYLIGIGLNRQPDVADAAPIQPNLADLPEGEYRRLARLFKPPASTRRLPFRSLHPDLMITTFSLVILFFLFNIYLSQPGNLLPVLILLGIGYTGYFWKRKSILLRFETSQASQRAAEQRVRQGIDRWMKLFYCARDGVVFEPGDKTPLPPEELARLWE
jgi:hypothetical protein